jgi:ribosomal protein S18 acetylase RimI-like enzyme
MIRMKIEFRKAKIPDEIEALCEFDRKAFAAFPADLFDPDDWAEYESYWMIADGQIVGCSAFIHDVDYDGRHRAKSLYITSTGVLPELRGRGMGTEQKKWQIEYAKQHGFRVIVTNMRESNSPIIRLNEKFGFTSREIVPGYYADPEEPAVVMELFLPAIPTRQ